MKRLIAGLAFGVIATLAVQRGIRYVGYRQHREPDQVFKWAYLHVPQTLSAIPGVVRMLDVTTEGVAATPSERARGETMVNVRLVYESDAQIKVVRAVCRFVNGKMMPPSDADIAALDAKAEPFPVPRTASQENQGFAATSPPALPPEMTPAQSPVPLQKDAVVLQETGDWDGTKQVYSISRKLAERTPDWEPDRGEPPLSTVKAIAIAEKAAKHRHPEVAAFRTASISLQGMNCTPVVPGKWFYMVYLHQITNQGEDPRGFWELVLLDGTVVTPTGNASHNGGAKKAS